MFSKTFINSYQNFILLSVSIFMRLFVIFFLPMDFSKDLAELLAFSSVYLSAGVNS